MSLLEKRRQLMNEVATKQKVKKGSVERKQNAQKQNSKSLGQDAQTAKVSTADSAGSPHEGSGQNQKAVEGPKSTRDDYGGDKS